MIVDVWFYFHLRWFCFSLIRSFWQERRRIEKRQTDQRRKKQGPRLQLTRFLESMCLFVPVHWFKIRLILREIIFCHVCNICNAQFSVQLEELERAFERAPYPDVFASEVSSVLLCIENIKMLNILRYLNQRIVLHIQMSLQVRFPQITSFFAFLLVYMCFCLLSFCHYFEKVKN